MRTSKFQPRLVPALLWLLFEGILGEKSGALGPGSQDMSHSEAEDAIRRYKETYFHRKQGEDPLRRHGQSLACSACRMAADRFQNKVARKIKGKMSEASRRSTFVKALPEACDPKNFGQQLAVVEKKGQEVYVDFQDAMANREGKVSVKRMSPEVRTDLIDACKHVLEEFHKELLQRLLDVPSNGKGSEVDFRKWLCGPKRAAVCEVEDDGDEEAEDADEESAEL
mmetsp:Transcript_52401/g.125172  ORF Transcript_52401/g.125172 Transcript_52401/m.125172 type:complete len:225 (+) Transcript_52401:41-715(+)